MTRTAHPTETGAVIFVEDYVVDQLEELLADEDGEDIEAVLQAQTNLSDLDRQHHASTFDCLERLVSGLQSG